MKMLSPAPPHRQGPGHLLRFCDLESRPWLPWGWARFPRSHSHIVHPRRITGPLLLLGARRLSRARDGPAAVQQGSVLGKAHRVELQVPAGLVVSGPTSRRRGQSCGAWWVSWLHGGRRGKFPPRSWIVGVTPEPESDECNSSLSSPRDPAGAREGGAGEWNSHSCPRRLFLARLPSGAKPAAWSMGPALLPGSDCCARG